MQIPFLILRLHLRPFPIPCVELLFSVPLAVESGPVFSRSFLGMAFAVCFFLQPFYLF